MRHILVLQLSVPKLRSGLTKSMTEISAATPCSAKGFDHVTTSDRVWSSERQ